MYVGRKTKSQCYHTGRFYTENDIPRIFVSDLVSPKEYWQALKTSRPIPNTWTILYPVKQIRINDNGEGGVGRGVAHCYQSVCHSQRVPLFPDYSVPYFRFGGYFRSGALVMAIFCDFLPPCHTSCDNGHTSLPLTAEKLHTRWIHIVRGYFNKMTAAKKAFALT